MSSRFFKKLKKSMEEMVAYKRGELKLHCETFMVPDAKTSDRHQVDIKKTSRKCRKSVEK